MSYRTSSTNAIEELRIDREYANFVLSEYREDKTVPVVRKRTIPTRDLNNIIKNQFSFHDKNFILPNCNNRRKASG